MIPKILILYLLLQKGLSQDDLFDGVFDGLFDVSSPPTTTDMWDGFFDTSTRMEDDINYATTSSSSDNSEVCECIPYYLCDGRVTANKKQDKYGGGLIQARISVRAECPHYLLKCCDEEDLVDVDLDDTTPPPQTKPDTLPPKGCGYRKFKPQAIPKEGFAEYGEFPWTVAIFYTDDTNRINYVCGGALIHPEVVLTAAHCLKNIKSDLKIRAGEYDSRNENEKYPHQDREVASATIHSRYDAKHLLNDIALLFLKKKVDLAAHINVVCLPPADTVLEMGRCISNGWGRESFGKEGVMTKVDLPMVSRVQCQSDLRRTNLGRYFMVHQSFVCAGGEPGKDTCKGDGGSPLVCPFKNGTDRFFQIGMVSGGIGCGGNRIPGLYVNVPLFRNWIDEKLKMKNLDLAKYQV